MPKIMFLALAFLAGTAMSLQAQATGTPSFNAPYRAFNQHEFGGTISFPEGADLGVEGQYRFGYQRFDLGLRGGVVNYPGTNRVILGAEGRTRMIQHSENFPLDGALVIGLGGNFGSGTSIANIVGGLPLGRRIDPRDSEVSIVLYVEPTLLLQSGGGDTEMLFAFGLGGDFRLSRVFDARVSVGFGDIEGIAFSAVWIR